MRRVDPSQQQIARGLSRIRRSWTSRERMKRRVHAGTAPQHWKCPEVPSRVMGLGDPGWYDDESVEVNDPCDA